MATDLALDSATNDLVLQNFDLKLVSDMDQLVQKLKSRLQFFSGEWFLDTTQGIDLLGTVLVKNPDLDLIQTLFKSTILGTPNVNSILSYSQSMDARARTLSVTFTIDTTYGQTTVTQIF